MFSFPRSGSVSSVVVALSVTAALGTELPEGFIETRLDGVLNSPVTMAIAPDGRIFVCQQGGDLRVFEDDALLPEPILSLPADGVDEQGLIGVTFDPDFETNQHFYVTYTTADDINRISRFTADGNRVVEGSESVVFELDRNVAEYHIGGALHFAPDGTLFTSTGDNANRSLPQSLDSLHGKILRINSDGSIPTDNPFFAVTSGTRRAIWALGFRNAFTFAIQSSTGRILINDVGGTAWEEINEGFPGANYGWPLREGPAGEEAFQDPLFAYRWGGSDDLRGRCVTGGVFYEPATSEFPLTYVGRYFFADYWNGWLATLDPDTGEAETFATGLFPGVVDVRVNADGALYYVARGRVTLDGGTGPEWDTGALFRIDYTPPEPPVIVEQPRDRLVGVGQSTVFGVVAGGTTDLRYQWRRNGVDIEGADNAEYVTDPADLTDDGAEFRCVVSNGRGNVTSDAATLHVRDRIVAVSWEGDYVTADTPCRRGWTVEYPVDLDGGNDDARAYFAYSDAEPVNPPEGEQYAPLESHRFYGGALIERSGASLSSSRWVEIWERGAKDQIYYSSRDEGTDGWALFYWKKEDFLDSDLLGTVSFTESSRLEIGPYEGGDGIREANWGHVRFVVRDGAQFYLSELSGDRSASTLALRDPASVRWARYDPTAPLGVKFDPETASFEPHTFDDITAVGFYHASETPGDPERRAGFTTAGFSFVLTDVSRPVRDRRLPGDCNADGSTDISDAVCVLVVLFVDSSFIPCEPEIDGTGNVGLLDFDGDATVTLTDAVALLNFIFLGGAPHHGGSSCVEIDGCPPGGCSSP